MTIMARLHKKGMLVRRREGKTDFYAPVHERDEYMALRAQAGVEELVASTGTSRSAASRSRWRVSTRPGDGRCSASRASPEPFRPAGAAVREARHGSRHGSAPRSTEHLPAASFRC